MSYGGIDCEVGDTRPLLRRSVMEKKSRQKPNQPNKSNAARAKRKKKRKNAVVEGPDAFRLMCFGLGGLRGMASLVEHLGKKDRS